MIQIPKDEGIAALTTSLITKAAGFAQYAFYRHFENVDDCLREVAGHIATHVRCSIDASRKLVHVLWTSAGRFAVGESDEAFESRFAKRT